MIWCLPGSSSSCHHHCSGCPAPQGCERWVSVLRRPSEGSALSPALWLLMAVTPSHITGYAGIPPRSLLLPCRSQQSRGWAQSHACVCCLAGEEDAGLALREMLRAWHYCSSSLLAFPKALWQPCEVWLGRITFCQCNLISPLPAGAQEAPATTQEVLGAGTQGQSLVPSHATRKPGYKLEGSIPAAFPPSPPFAAGESRDISPRPSCSHLGLLTVGLQGADMVCLGLSLSSGWCGRACPYIPAVHAGFCGCCMQAGPSSAG